MAAPVQVTGLMGLACTSAAWAGVVGTVLGLAASGLGAFVAGRSQAVGLRERPAPRPLVWLGQGLLPGLLAVALYGSARDVWLLAVALGAVYGYTAAELANHLRSAFALAAVLSEEDGLAQWRAVSPTLRGRLILGQLAAALVVVLVAALMSLEPGLMGLAAGVMLQWIGVRGAVRDRRPSTGPTQPSAGPTQPSA